MSSNKRVVVGGGNSGGGLRRHWICPGKKFSEDTLEGLGWELSLDQSPEKVREIMKRMAAAGNYHCDMERTFHDDRAFKQFLRLHSQNCRWTKEHLPQLLKMPWCQYSHQPGGRGQTQQGWGDVGRVFSTNERRGPTTVTAILDDGSVDSSSVISEITTSIASLQHTIASNIDEIGMEVLKDISDEISFTPDYYAIYRELMSQVSEGLSATAERVEELEREFLPARVFFPLFSLLLLLVFLLTFNHFSI